MCNPVMYNVVHNRKSRRGLSLLEMILATAILMAGALTIARLSFVTSSHAIRAQDDSIALQIAAYHLDQLKLERRSLEAVTMQPVVETNDLASLDTSDSSIQRITTWDDWYYSITIQPNRRTGLSTVQLDVYRFPPNQISDGLATPTGDTSSGGASSVNSQATTDNSANGTDTSTSQDSTALYHRSFLMIVSGTASSPSETDSMEAAW